MRPCYDQAFTAMSHPPDTVCGVWQFGMVAGQLVVQLPVVVVLVVALVLVAGRRRSIGSRRAHLAIAGLIAIAVDVVLSMAWSVLVPTLVTEFGLRITRVGLFSAVAGFALAAIMAGGIGLLIAAVITAPGPAGSGVPAPFSAAPGYGVPGQARPNRAASPADPQSPGG
jgi:hypothetical protein